MVNLVILIINLISTAFVYFGLQLGWLISFNIIFFLAWLFSLNIFSALILSKIFSLPKIYLKILSLFLDIVLLGFIANISTSWLVFNNLSFLISLMATSLILFLWSYGLRNIKPLPQTYLGKNEGLWDFKSWLLIVFSVLTSAGFIVIFLVQTSAYLSSPWQVLPFWYALIILILLLFVFSLVFSKKKVWLILTSIIIISFLMHSYLLVYSQGFGGDKWRHLGSENRILSELAYQPTLLANDIWYKNIGGLNLPQALIAGPKISYGFEWSLAVTIAKIFQIDIFILDKYLILILWSLFLPLMAFILALQLKVKNRYALLASALTLIFYILQYYGSQTLPISFSALYFLFLISCFLSYVNNKQSGILLFLIFLTALSYFGYSLAFIILILSLIWSLAVSLKPLKKYLIFFASSLSIFIIELVSDFSSLKSQFSLREIIGAALVRGNFLFFEKGQFLPLALKYWPILSLIISLLLGGVLIASILKMLKEKKPTHLFLVGLGFILIINYLCSWIFLDGLHTLARRMNVFIVLVFIFVLAYGLSCFVSHKNKAVLAVLILSLVGFLTYSSGPILEAAVSGDDTLSMKYVWSQVYGEPKKYCVLANSWPLLALESYSAKEIIAGNFPSDFNYSQPERVNLLADFIKKPSLSLLDEAMIVTGTSSCFIVINYNSLNDVMIYQINNLLGQPKIFGQNLVWRYK
ncbi:MAG: hypothetical protein Q7K65_00555 [Candidatus Buchananbacteria bacterium]|nr:hypothetical protein [Candidatus Buchananbacteria bacterium]